MIKHHVMFPENSWVDEGRIRMWYADAIANDEFDREDLINLDEIKSELEDTGKVSFCFEAN